jgi:hypothetical protein
MAEENPNSGVTTEAPSHEPDKLFSDIGYIAKYQQDQNAINLEQYKRSVYVPPELNRDQLSKIYEMPQYRYGTETAQKYNRELYARQSEVARSSFSATSAQWAMDATIFSGASALTTAAGVGAIGSLAIPLGVSYAAMYPIRKAMDKEVARRQESVGIANDISMFRDQAGLKYSSFREVNSLARGMRNDMGKGGFWSKDDQLKMHSIALGEGILDSMAPGSTNTQGSTEQYKKNFDELKKVTKDIVETLHTTMEGGLALIKDMKQKGHTSMQKIRTELIRAKAFGDATGIGTENMLRVQDAGGERAYAQGMTRDYGASTYRTGYAQLHAQGMGSQTMAASINRVGGMESATQIVNDAGINFIQSKLGTQLWAASTNAKGEWDYKFLDKLSNKKASASEITNRSHHRGAAMGDSGRALAERHKMEAWEKAGSDGTALMIMQAQFKGSLHAWKRDRPGITNEAAAQKFAEMWLPGQDIRAQSLLADHMLAGSQEQYLRAIKLSATASDNRLGGVGVMNPLRRKYNEAVATTYGAFNKMGVDLVNGSDRIMNVTSSAFGKVRMSAAAAANDWIVNAFGTEEEKESWSKYGMRAGAPTSWASEKEVIDFRYGIGGIDKESVIKGGAILRRRGSQAAPFGEMKEMTPDRYEELNRGSVSDHLDKTSLSKRKQNYARDSLSKMSLSELKSTSDMVQTIARGERPKYLTDLQRTSGLDRQELQSFLPEALVDETNRRLKGGEKKFSTSSVESHNLGQESQRKLLNGIISDVSPLNRAAKKKLGIDGTMDDMRSNMKNLSAGQLEDFMTKTSMVVEMQGQADASANDIEYNRVLNIKDYTGLSNTERKEAAGLGFNQARKIAETANAELAASRALIEKLDKDKSVDKNKVQSALDMLIRATEESDSYTKKRRNISTVSGHKSLLAEEKDVSDVIKKILKSDKKEDKLAVEKFVSGQLREIKVPLGRDVSLNMDTVTYEKDKALSKFDNLIDTDEYVESKSNVKGIRGKYNPQAKKIGYGDALLELGRATPGVGLLVGAYDTYNYLSAPKASEAQRKSESAAFSADGMSKNKALLSERDDMRRLAGGTADREEFMKIMSEYKAAKDIKAPSAASNLLLTEAQNKVLALADKRGFGKDGVKGFSFNLLSSEYGKAVLEAATESEKRIEDTLVARGRLGAVQTTNRFMLGFTEGEAFTTLAQFKDPATYNEAKSFQKNTMTLVEGLGGRKEVGALLDTLKKNTTQGSFMNRVIGVGNVEELDKLYKSKASDETLGKAAQRMLLDASDSGAMNEVTIEEAKKDLLLKANEYAKIEKASREDPNETNREKHKAALNDLARDSQVAANKLVGLTASAGGGGGGGTMGQQSAMVQPPAMNYWNNRWAL